MTVRIGLRDACLQRSVESYEQVVYIRYFLRTENDRGHIKVTLWSKSTSDAQRVVILIRTNKESISLVCYQTVDRQQYSDIPILTASII